MIIRKAKESDIPAIVQLHYTNLKEGVLHQLGKKTLSLFYRGIFKDKKSFILLCVRGEYIAGAVAASCDSGKTISRIKKENFSKLIWPCLALLIKRPRFVTHFLKEESNQPLGSELMFIFVDNDSRRQGIGDKLIEATSKEFSKRGVKKYRITILPTNSGGKKFYERNKFNKEKELVYFGEKREIYSHTIRV
jgi:ribosomal protein S18 acetylase RimI-like enzyme